MSSNLSSMNATQQKEFFNIEFCTDNGSPALFRHIMDVSTYGNSRWAETFKIDVLESKDNAQTSYFVKVTPFPFSTPRHQRSFFVCRKVVGLTMFDKISPNAEAHKSFRVEYDITKTFYERSKGKHTPKPSLCGSFRYKKYGHYYISHFVPLLDRLLPTSEVLASMLKSFHNHCENPEGKFGHHVTTCYGNIPQYVQWQVTWEKFFSESFQHAYDECVKRNDDWSEIKNLVQDFRLIVMPRLLRSLETGGSFIKPVLLHGDLWKGNAGVSEMGMCQSYLTLLHSGDIMNVSRTMLKEQCRI